MNDHNVFFYFRINLGTQTEPAFDNARPKTKQICVGALDDNVYIYINM